MADLKLIKPLGVQNIINKFCFTIGMIPTSYKLSLSYEEQILSIGKYLEETVIPALNNNAEAVAELQALFVQLKDYVENYFDNLDVQNEINNKLDKMAEDGTLTNLINKYINGYVDPKIENLQTQINSIGNGSPIPVSSIEQMTDINRIYVLTTDGNWYYYEDGWKIGGVYQASQIDKNSIDLYELNETISNDISNKKTLFIQWKPDSHYRIEDGKAVEYTNVTGYSSTILDVLPNEIYNIVLPQRSANARGYIFTDNDLNVITSGMVGTGENLLQKELVKVPVGATKMINCVYNISGERHIDKVDYKKRDVTIDEKLYNTKLYQDIEVKYNRTNNSYYTLDNGLITKYSDTTPYSTTEISCLENEIYKIKMRSYYTNVIGIIFTNENNELIDYTNVGNGIRTDDVYIIKIPLNCTKMLISFGTAGEFYIEKLIPTNILKDKIIAVIGDSISTKINKNAYEITIEQEDIGKELSAYPTYYDVNNGLTIGGHTFTNEEIGQEIFFTPVDGDVGKKIGLANNYNAESITTWWEYLEENFGCKVIPVCWSGASITSHEKNSIAYKTSYSWHDAQIRKCGIRIPGTMERLSPDYIIIYRGTNDFSHSPYTYIEDDFENYNYEYPSDDFKNNKYNYVDGMSILIKKLRETYSTSNIYLCTLNIFKRVNYSHFPTNNGINSLPQYNNKIRDIANYFGCNIIELDKDGITFENCYKDGYITDSEEKPTHPNSKGHYKIYEQVIKDMLV